MEHITVNLKELIMHCKEWENECENVIVTIDQENNTLGIDGSECDGFGIIASDLDPIVGIATENPFFIMG